jgi:hypothetical protein
MAQITLSSVVEELTKQKEDANARRLELPRFLRAVLMVTGSVLVGFFLLVLLVIIDAMYVPPAACACGSRRKEAPHLRPEGLVLNLQRGEGRSVER